MIIIFTEATDITSTFVLDWLFYYKKEFMVIYPNSYIEITDIFVETEKGINFTLAKKELHNVSFTEYKDIEAVWYRRGELTPKNFKINEVQFSTDKNISNAINHHLQNEKKHLIDFIYEALNKKRILGNGFKFEVNKMSNLLKAFEIGLCIPTSAIITNKQQLLEMKKSTPELITKSIQQMFYLKYRNGYYNNYTERLDDLFIEGINDSFFPTLIQEKIDKEYEIRTFYIDNNFFSMAIFSQNDPQTSVDFRKYNKQKPNRTVPYNLPKAIEAKIITLMKRLDLNTGSLDFVMTKKGEYVFLEVNPIGQFGMVSAPCNYNLEKKIAQYLINP
jgi:ATP-GRASP peptide maturase of grasp-with-spasm system